MNERLRRVKFDQIVSVAEYSRRVQNKIKHEYANVIGFFQTAKYTKERKVFWEGLKVEGGRTAFKKHLWGRFRRAKLDFAPLPFFSFLCASSRPCG